MVQSAMNDMSHMKPCKSRIYAIIYESYFSFVIDMNVTTLNNSVISHCVSGWKSNT